jgi:UDP-N-acetylmuramate: L-alanyl-gamma-D-glutamyl-meso-diaminopimelate ligase
MHIHILGICGTFMGSLALLARERGFRVTGCDANVYPPMSTQLETAGIELVEGFDAGQLKLQPDVFVIGNAMSRGNPLVEAILNSGLPYTSGPQFFAEHILAGRWVLAVSGTHGKTTTTAMLSWILEYAGYQPGFLIGGVPKNFDVSARLGGSDFFVVEADEYDSAFFDKRSKFVHYRPRTLILNNLEFDHADIFPDLAAIQRQFHHLIRTVPSEGSILYPLGNDAIDETISWGSWSELVSLGIEDSGAAWQSAAINPDGSQLKISSAKHGSVEFSWQQTGEHNVANALAASAAAHAVGVPLEVSAQALSKFEGVKRRMEVIAEANDITLYDDFAHHPTAIQTTLEGLRNKYPQDRIVAIIEPRSNTMKMGVHQKQLAASISTADRVLWFKPEDLDWNPADFCRSADSCYQTIEELAGAALDGASGPLHLVVMSNGGFGGLREKLISVLQKGA